MMEPALLDDGGQSHLSFPKEEGAINKADRDLRRDS